MSDDDIPEENLICLDLVEPKRIAQTITEMKFALSLLPCGRCGAYERDPINYHYIGDPHEDSTQSSHFAVECRCPQCGTSRQLVSWTIHEPRVRFDRMQLVGSQPSNIIEPYQFMVEMDRLTSIVHATPSQLGWVEFRVSFRGLERSLTCCNELRKFVVEEQADILATEYTEAGRAHRAAHPERYLAASVEAHHAHLTALYATHMIEIPRVQAEASLAQGPPKVSVGQLNRDTVRAHQAWIDRGKVGEGRLVLKHQRVREQRLPAHLLGTQWFDVELDRVTLSYSRLEKSEFEQCTVKATRMEGTTLPYCTLLHCTFEDSYLNLVSFLGSKITDCTFTYCEMFRSKWVDAVVHETTFRRTKLHDARFDGATFTHCTFSGNYIGAGDLGRLATTAGARFEDCDFRETGWHQRDLSGATFVRCQFAGSGQMPRAWDGLVLEDCDMSRDQFLTMLAAADAEEAQRVASAGNDQAD